MNRDNSNIPANRQIDSPQMLYRGLYVRIAQKLGVDPSYVSRVARGDRRSSQIENALREALDAIDQQLGRANRRKLHSASAPQRLKVLLKQNQTRIRKQWLAHSNADPDLKRVKIAAQTRIAPIVPLINETIKVMMLNLKDMPGTKMKAAERHGRLRQVQGFTPMALVEEYNLVRRCVFALAQEHLERMDPQLLIRDLTQFGEALDLQLQRALGDYLASA